MSKKNDSQSSLLGGQAVSGQLAALSSSMATGAMQRIMGCWISFFSNEQNYALNCFRINENLSEFCASSEIFIQVPM